MTAASSTEGCGSERIFDLLGVDVLSPTDDHVLDAIDQGQVAVLVEDSDVTGMQPTILDGLRSLLRLTQIATHHVATLDDHLSGSPGGRKGSVLGKNGNLLAGQRRADRTEFAHAVHRIAGRRTGPLGESVTFHDHETETPLSAFEEFLADRRRTAHGKPQGRRVDRGVFRL